MEKEKAPSPELEKYVATLQELKELQEKIAQKINQDASSIEKLYQIIESENLSLEKLMTSVDELERERERKTRLYKLILQSASMFTLGTIASVIVNVIAEQLTKISFPIVLVVSGIGVGVIIVFAYKSWLDYSAQKEISATKKILQTIEKLN